MFLYITLAISSYFWKHVLLTSYDVPCCSVCLVCWHFVISQSCPVIPTTTTKNLSILCLACYNLYYYFPICNKVPLHQWCEFVCNRVLCCGWERACTDGCELEKGGCKRNLNGQWNRYPLNVYPPLCTCLFTPHLVNTILQVTHMRFAFKYMGFRAGFLCP